MEVSKQSGENYGVMNLKSNRKKNENPGEKPLLSDIKLTNQELKLTN
jgi:hypothetical protein